MREFILASASPRRRELLAAAGFNFKICTADIVEDEDPNGDPQKAVAYNAREKALAVAKQFPDAIVLGADTTVALGNVVLNKPADMNEAHAMLKKLGGNTHTVYTGVCIVCKATQLCDERIVACNVTFKPLDDNTICEYFKHVNPLDKAGAYGAQEARELIIDHYDEPLSNIIGLPIEIIAPILKKLNIKN